MYTKMNTSNLNHPGVSNVTNSNFENRIYTAGQSTQVLLPFLVFIRTLFYPNRNQICSGTLIGTGPTNAWVLTAKHCIHELGTRDVRRFHLCGQQDPCVSNNCAVNFGFVNDRFAAVNQFGDDEVYFYGTESAARRSHYSRIVPDVVLIKLANLNAYPAITCHQFASIESFQLQRSDHVNVVGYGVNTIASEVNAPPPNNAGVLRQTRTQVSSREMSTDFTTPVNFSQTDTYILEPNDLSNPVGARFGDSGGPTLNYQTGNVIAVNSWIITNDVQVVTTGSVSVTSDSMRSWIQRVVYSHNISSFSPPATPTPAMTHLNDTNIASPPAISPSSPDILYIRERINLSYLLVGACVFATLFICIIIVMIVYCVILDANEN